MIETLFTYKEEPKTNATIIAIDVLRAGSVIITALFNGAKLVKITNSIKKAREMKKDGFIICGERNTTKIKGFDKGNSPLEYFDVKGKKIVLTTSNGTKVVEKASKISSKILIGSFLNLDFLIDYVKNDENIVLWCAGNNGNVSFEDTLFAGAFLEKLKKENRNDLSDSSIISLNFWKQTGLKFEGEHAKKLISMGFKDDVEFCKRISVYNVIPVYLNGAFYEVRTC
ncbi:MAG: 2-phosphosulfolactate phosphatase [Thermosipho sp. (in: thermotogales)]|nr:2-phosphosulfolactate phosphatase [Thermosipho sp. (in: thermotogales)]MDK2886407.1 2-phosphosulfolactate phosphatase [Thermosipho sp. (in: thermotogales)]